MNEIQTAIGHFKNPLKDFSQHQKPKLKKQSGPKHAPCLRPEIRMAKTNFLSMAYLNYKLLSLLNKNKSLLSDQHVFIWTQD